MSIFVVDDDVVVVVDVDAEFSNDGCWAFDARKLADDIDVDDEVVVVVVVIDDEDDDEDLLDLARSLSAKQS